MKKNTISLLIGIAFIICSVNASGIPNDDTIIQAIQYRIKGYAYQRRGDLPNAITNYRLAVQSDPKYACAHNDLGILYEQMGQSKAAEEEYLKAIESDASYVSAYSNLAFFYERANRPEAACYYWGKRAEMGRSDDRWTINAKNKYKELSTMLADQQRQKELKVSVDDLKGQAKKRFDETGSNEDFLNLGSGEQDELLEAQKFAKVFADDKNNENKQKQKYLKQKQKNENTCKNYLDSAVRLMANTNYDAALKQYKKIKDLDPEYPNINGLIEKAEDGIRERQQQLKLEADQKRLARQEALEKRKYEEENRKLEIDQRKLEQQRQARESLSQKEKKDAEYLKKQQGKAKRDLEEQNRMQEWVKNQKKEQEERLKKQQQQQSKKDARNLSRIDKITQQEEARLEKEIKVQDERAQKQREQEQVLIEKKNKQEQERQKKLIEAEKRKIDEENARIEKMKQKLDKERAAQEAIQENIELEEDMDIQAQIERQKDEEISLAKKQEKFQQSILEKVKSDEGRMIKDREQQAKKEKKAQDERAQKQREEEQAFIEKKNKLEQEQQKKLKEAEERRKAEENARIEKMNQKLQREQAAQQERFQQSELEKKKNEDQQYQDPQSEEQAGLDKLLKRQRELEVELGLSPESAAENEPALVKPAKQNSDKLQKSQKPDKPEIKDSKQKLQKKIDQLLNQAEDYIAAKRYDLAVNKYYDIEKLDPQYPRLEELITNAKEDKLKFEAEIKLKAEQKKSAVQEEKDRKEQQKISAQIEEHLAKAEQYVLNGQYDAAILRYNRIYQLDQNYPGLQGLIDKANESKADKSVIAQPKEEAQKEMPKKITLKKEPAKPAKKEIPKAAGPKRNDQDIEKERHQKLNEAEQHFKKGQSFYLSSKYDEAAKELEIALAINPDHAEANRLLRYCQRRTQQGLYRPLEESISRPTVTQTQVAVQPSRTDVYEETDIESPEAVEKRVTQELSKEEKSSLNVSDEDIQKKYQVIGTVAYRGQTNDIDALNNELLNKAKALGGEEVVQVRYFQHNDYIYGYGTAVRKKIK